MPIYSYLCQHCGHSFDQFQHFTDDALTVCPACNEVALRKVYTPVGIVFKGKGFYATDHRSPSGQTTNHKSENEGNNGFKTEKAEPSKTPAAAPEASKQTSTAG